LTKGLLIAGIVSAAAAGALLGPLAATARAPRVVKPAEAPAASHGFDPQKYAVARVLDKAIDQGRRFTPVEWSQAKALLEDSDPRMVRRSMDYARLAAVDSAQKEEAIRILASLSRHSNEEVRRSAMDTLKKVRSHD
jgi:hypothetical protein